MLIKTISQKIIFVGILAGALVAVRVQAEAPVDAVAQLQQELNKVKQELALSQAKVAEQGAQIVQMEKLKAGSMLPAVASGDTARLEQELKTSKSKISELEEQLFVATDGKGVKGQEVAEVLPEGTYEWTENMRRTPIGVLFPKTATIPKGDVYARFSHTSQNQTFATGGKGDPFNDLLGLESGVKVGILFGYGITKNWDVLVQRSNGRDFEPIKRYPDDIQTHSFDLWDVMTKYKFLDENKQFIDMSASVGGTYFWQDQEAGKWAGNAALMAEKSFWRFRVGSGLLYTSLSAFQGAYSDDSDRAHTKVYLNESPELDVVTGAPLDRPQNQTMAIPVSLSFALTKSQQLFGEAAFPVNGYDTGNGPSLAAGWRYNTHTHAYSIYLSNTANGSFNSSFTGGYTRNRLDLFGFDISIFF